VAGHALVGGKALQQRVGGAQLQPLADEAVGDAVIVAFELDVVVNVP
jgi:hypothetical protein